MKNTLRPDPDDEPILDFDDDSPPFESTYEDGAESFCPEPPSSPILSRAPRLDQSSPSLPAPDPALKPKSFVFKKPAGLANKLAATSQPDSFKENCDIPSDKANYLKKGFDFNSTATASGASNSSYSGGSSSAYNAPSTSAYNVASSSAYSATPSSAYSAASSSYTPPKSNSYVPTSFGLSSSVTAENYGTQFIEDFHTQDELPNYIEEEEEDYGGGDIDYNKQLYATQRLVSSYRM